MDDINALPVARLAFPTQRIILSGALVEGCTTVQDVLVEIAVMPGIVAPFIGPPLSECKKLRLRPKLYQLEIAFDTAFLRVLP